MLIPAAYAQTTGDAAASSGSGLILFLPYLLLIPLFYFLMIRPQQRRAKEHAARLAATKKGDTVVTAGGIVGKVTRVEDAHVEVEIAANVKVRVVKATLTDVTPLAGAKPAND